MPQGVSRGRFPSRWSWELWRLWREYEDFMVVVSMLLGSDMVVIPFRYLSIYIIDLNGKNIWWYVLITWREKGYSIWIVMLCRSRWRCFKVRQLTGFFRFCHWLCPPANRYVSQYRGHKRRIRRKRTRRKIREEGQALSGAQFCLEERDFVGQDKLETVLPQQPLVRF